MFQENIYMTIINNEYFAPYKTLQTIEIMIIIIINECTFKKIIIQININNNILAPFKSFQRIMIIVNK